MHRSISLQTPRGFLPLSSSQSLVERLRDPDDRIAIDEIEHAKGGARYFSIRSNKGMETTGRMTLYRRICYTVFEKRITSLNTIRWFLILLIRGWSVTRDFNGGGNLTFMKRVAWAWKSLRPGLETSHSLPLYPWLGGIEIREKRRGHLLLEGASQSEVSTDQYLVTS